MYTGLNALGQISVAVAEVLIISHSSTVSVMVDSLSLSLSNRGGVMCLCRKSLARLVAES